MTRDLLHTPFDRRALLRGLGLAALAAGAGGGLAGCASAVEEQRAAANTAGSAPVRGGTLALAARDDLIPGNLLTNTTDGITVLIGLVYDTLTRYPNDKVEPGPRLATSWQLAADGRSLTLQLRDDVYFHARDGGRGRQFTSADAAFSLRTYADPKWTAQLRSTAAAISDYDTRDPHRLVLHFAQPLSNIFDLLDTVPILDSETLPELAAGKTYLGTGPFRFESWTPNTAITFVRNEHYRVPERPYLDRVELSIVGDTQALLAGIRSNRYDVAHGLPFRDVATLAQSGGFRSLTMEGAEKQTYVGANVTAPGLSDVRVRQAIAYGVDRQRVVDEVLRGSGYPVNLPWPKYSPAFDAGRNTAYTRDVGTAKALLSEVGAVPNVPLSFPAKDPVHEPVAQILQANLGEIGIATTLQPLETAQFTKALIGARFPGLWTTYHSWAQYTPSTLTASAYPFNARRNSSNFSSPAYLKAADAAWELPGNDAAAARRAYDALNGQLLDNLFLVELGVVLDQFVAADRVQGIGWSKRSEIDLTDAYKAV